jgi:argininosuccinate lyase
VSNVVKHSVAAGLDANEITLELVNEIALQVIGRKLSLTAEQLRLALDPVHFVDIRTLPGGPAPAEIRGTIAKRKTSQQSQEKWLDAARAQVEGALAELDRTLAGWGGSL